MCGIAGVLWFEGGPPRDVHGALSRMQRALLHRGPDGRGAWEAADVSGLHVGLTHTRLAILDLSDAAAQPMRRGPLAITYNGEIYNFRAIRDELATGGARFQTASDTEVLLAAYERWGVAAVDRLQGMFAFAIWDGAARRLLLARDRLGIKPLYYASLPDGLVFASEVRALLASGVVPATLADDGLWMYLGYQTAATPSTLLREVAMLEPGHTLEATGRGCVHRRRYWDFLQHTVALFPAPTLAAARQRVREALTEAVTSHLVSDVPVGVFLSGGIDSGAILSALASAGVRPQTFTVAVGEHACDESAAAAATAAAFGARHTEIGLTEHALLDMMPEVLAAVDHPTGDGVNAYVVARAVREHGVTVALSGLGGDELFGGYPSFRRVRRVAPVAKHWGRSPRFVRRAAAGLVRAGAGGSVAAAKLADAVASDGRVSSLWPVTRQLFSERQRRQLLPEAWWPATDDADPYQRLVADAGAAAPAVDAWALVSYGEARAYMHDVLLRDADQMSMAHAVEVRVPFLDHCFVETVLALPSALKRLGPPKALLVDSLAQPLPAAVRDAPKRGFTLPFDAWMRGALRPFCEAQLGDRGLEGRRLFRPGAVERLWRQFLDRQRGVPWPRLWMLVALNAWLDRLGVARSR